MTRRFLTIILSIFALALTVQGQSVDYKGAPWVTRTSAPYTIDRGLSGRHLSVWSSHGRYFEAKKNQWLWQRPYLFCTTEDLLTQSFVNPYLIPMLEKAGAVVFTPKERDTQPNEAIVDNDTPGRNGFYVENGMWNDCGVGFGLDFSALNDTVQPFSLGSVRSVSVNHDAEAIWMPEIPESGHYAVYVSYASIPSSVDDARYVVHHAGGESTFRVNQQIGGGTWVYLGTFYFEAGQSERSRVVLCSDSRHTGFAPDGSPYAVTADAVRFGGGRSLIERSIPTESSKVVSRTVTNTVDGQSVKTTLSDTVKVYTYGKGEKSGLPRFLEGARYTTQFAGLADTLFNKGHGTDDYRDDMRARSHMLNLLGGGSCFMPDTLGRGVPFELQFALHTDAGWRQNDDIVGTLTIATPYGDNGSTDYRSGLTRDAARSLADNMLKGIASDFSRLYGVTWPKRELRIDNYAETRSPQVPSTILELLAHQNFTDMTFAHDPNFKFAASRAIYKVLLREVYRNHGLPEPVVQPLPVKNISATLDSNQPYAKAGPHAMASVVLSWQPQDDPLEPSAKATDYVLYTREGNDDWDEGTLCNGKHNIKVTLKPGLHHQFRVSALNDGGESFPSEIVSVYIAPYKANPESSKKNALVKAPTILLVNDFDRLSGPARINNATQQGFDINRDAGVYYGDNTSFCGAQTIFDRTQGGKEGPGALGYSGTEYMGKSIAGNRFDDIVLHARDILAVSTDYNIVSMTRGAFDQLHSDALKKYDVIDFITGLQADKSYNLKHYDVFANQTRKLLADYAKQGGKLFVSGAFLGEPAATPTPSDAKINVSENDSVFLAQVLHCNYRATINHRQRAVFSGLGIDIPVFNVPTAAHYACQESTVLEAVGNDAFPAFAYCNSVEGTGYSAGVAWPDGVVMGFPYDCIIDNRTRQSVMRAVLTYLLEKQ